MLVGHFLRQLEWHKFAPMHNHTDNGMVTHDFSIQTDVLGSWGCRAFFQEKLLLLEWPPQWSIVHMMSKELLPIVLSRAVWGPLLPQHKVLFQCDNSGVVVAL